VAVADKANDQQQNFSSCLANLFLQQTLVTNKSFDQPVDNNFAP
jgi:hypothetical protein